MCLGLKPAQKEEKREHAQEEEDENQFSISSSCVFLFLRLPASLRGLNLQEQPVVNSHGLENSFSITCCFHRLKRCQIMVCWVGAPRLIIY
jgi:hypothetical protein